MHEKITDIQNSFWKAYKDFRENQDYEQYNTSVKAIAKKYQSDKKMLDFIKSLLIAWTPVINLWKE